MPESAVLCFREASKAIWCRLFQARYYSVRGTIWSRLRYIADPAYRNMLTKEKSPNDVLLGDTPLSYEPSRQTVKSWSNTVSRGLLLAALGLFAVERLCHSTHKLARTTAPRTDSIEWSSCGDNFECGRLLVPLDYHNKTSGYANLSVSRYLAKNSKNRIGSLFLNPVGPGYSALIFLFQTGPALAELLDDRYDIIAWDARGINGTTPGVDCFASQTAQDIALSHTYQDIGFETRNLSDPVERAVYAQQVRKADAENSVIAELCRNRTGEALRHVGTATVVRDLELLSRVIEGPESPVNFWGFSYGSAVASYFVNMFPHRVGNAAIDCVVDPEVWANTGAHQHVKWDLVDAEKAYNNFLHACAEAGPDRCALSTENTSTEAAIRKAVDELIEGLYQRPLPVPMGKSPYILTSGLVRKLIFKAMYHPRKWNVLAEQLAAGIRGDGAPIIDAMLTAVELNTTKKATTTMAIEAITCVDGPNLWGTDPHEAVEAVVEANVNAYEKLSTHFSALEVPMCHHWKPRESERYVGPFNGTMLANNILVIGNTADPITPVANARTVNQLLPQSRLIVQDGSGHCSFSMASTCTAKAVRGYFLDGVLPPNDIVCDTVERLFPEKSSAPGVKAWLDPETSISDADASLVATVRKLGQAFEPFIGLHKM